MKTPFPKIANRTMSERAKLTRRNLLVGMALAPIAAVVPANPADEWVPLPDLTLVSPISNFDDALRQMMAAMAKYADSQKHLS